jgi:hypothetical protein
MGRRDLGNGAGKDEKWMPALKKIRGASGWRGVGVFDLVYSRVNYKHPPAPAGEPVAGSLCASLGWRWRLARACIPASDSCSPGQHPTQDGAVDRVLRRLHSGDIVQLLHQKDNQSGNKSWSISDVWETMGHVFR